MTSFVKTRLACRIFEDFIILNVVEGILPKWRVFVLVFAVTLGDDHIVQIITLE